MYTHKLIPIKLPTLLKYLFFLWRLWLITHHRSIHLLLLHVTKFIKLLSLLLFFLLILLIIRNGLLRLEMRLLLLKLLQINLLFMLILIHRSFRVLSFRV